MSNYTSPINNNNYDDRSDSNANKKTRKRTPSVAKDSRNPLTNYLQTNTNVKTTNKGSKQKKQITTVGRYGIDDLLTQNERYKSHQHEKHRALNEIRRIDDSLSSDSDLEMEVHAGLLEKGAEKTGDLEERKQALESHQKIQKVR
mgnify:CR=1 FL=1